MLNITLESAIIFGFLTVFSFGLLIISIFSYYKSKNKKIIFVNLVFLLFLLKGILLSLSIFIPEIQDFFDIMLFSVIDLFILFLLFIAVLKAQ